MFRSYLTDRRQYVVYDKGKSDFADIKTGVPHGSVLGPLLFLVYINDFPTASKLFKFLMYADDTTLCYSLNNTPHNDTLNKELHKISTWLACNKLSLNIDKTKLMIFHMKQRSIIYPVLSINNTLIEKVKSFNFLGLTISDDLKWHTHIRNVSRKISRSIGVINVLKHTFPTHILNTLYSSLVLPHLNYCLLSWGYYSETIFNLQKKAIRAITCSHYKAHTNPLFKSLKFLKIGDMYALKILKFYFNLCQDKLPPNMNDYKLLLSSGHSSYELRHETFQLPKIKHEYAKSMLYYQLPITINSTAKLILDKAFTHSFQGYSLYIKNIFVNNYKEECSLINCYICSKK